MFYKVIIAFGLNLKLIMFRLDNVQSQNTYRMHRKVVMRDLDLRKCWLQKYFKRCKIYIIAFINWKIQSRKNSKN